MIFDTDVLIWTLRGNLKAAKIIEQDADRALSVVSCMELLQGARDKKELAHLRQFLRNFKTIPLSGEIGLRGCQYVEEYSLRVSLGPVDALIAATAVELQQPLCTGNTKHYRMIPELDLKGFRP